MLNDNKPIGVYPTTPGFAPEIGGAPVSMPGGNDGTDKTKMSGTPVALASVPPPVSSDLAGSPQAGQEVQSATTPTIAVSTDTTDTDKPARAAQTDEERQRADAVAGSDRQIKTIQDWMDAEENRPETAEQRKKRERMEKSKRIIAAVSDGISALSNLYFTSQYAPNMYNHEKGSQLTATNDRIERLKAEREKKKDQYLNFSLKLGDIENDRAKTLLELEAQQERQKLAREEAQRKAEEHNWNALLQPDKQREQAAKANKAQQEAITAQVVAQYAPQRQQAELETEHARARAQNSSAANSYASARAHDRSNPQEFYGTGKDGKEYPFSTREAAIDFEHRQETYYPAKWGHDVVEETTVTGKETSAGGKTISKKKVYPQKKQSPTAGGGGSKKSPTS